MSLLDQCLLELRSKPGGIVGMLEDYQPRSTSITERINSERAAFEKWLNSFMQPSAISTAVAEVPVEDMGIYKFAAVDKDGNPVAFYGESFRNAAMKYVEENP